MLARVHVGYRHLHIPPKHKGLHVNLKKLYRLYKEEQLPSTNFIIVHTLLLGKFAYNAKTILMGSPSQAGKCPPRSPKLTLFARTWSVGKVPETDAGELEGVRVECG